MKEHPILFSAPMVRAILDGTKTQTRRVVKPQPQMVTDNSATTWDGDAAALLALLNQAGRRCPYGQPGDREWRTGPMPGAGWYYVRGLLDPSVGGDERPVWVSPEHFTFGFSEQDDPESIELDADITPENVQWKRPGDRLWVRETHNTHGGLATYRADGDWIADYHREEPQQPRLRWVPAIHMPRTASRITLEVTGVRVERLQDISEADVIAEGIQRWPLGFRVALSGAPKHESMNFETASNAYRHLWTRINGPESWDANPWVWVVEFRKLG